LEGRENQLRREEQLVHLGEAIVLVMQAGNRCPMLMTSSRGRKTVQEGGTTQCTVSFPFFICRQSLERSNVTIA